MAETLGEPPKSTPPMDSHNFPSIMFSCFPITLKFLDVCYRVRVQDNVSTTNLTKMFNLPDPTQTSQEKIILTNITGTVSPGEILAVLGPSGSGKSTLLNALAGRLHGQNLTGSILANGRKLTKPVLKRTGFVTQDDVLYPHLTVKETLIFCSLLRLPSTLSKPEKIAIATSIITELGLDKCENTLIGNSFIRGVSGGERKRVSIAHEMLINPSLLVLDEPTSGLDSTAAHRLLSTLKSLAAKGKTVVTSVHQPSSRVYQMFDKVLVLSEGRSIYFGKGSESMNYFESIGFSPSFPMNPADFLLDLANGVCQLEGATETDKPNVKQVLVSSYNNLVAPRVKALCMEATNLIPTETKIQSTGVTQNPNRNACSTCISTWFNQFGILMQRSLKERKHETLNSLRVFQVLAASLLAGSMWWHSDYHDVQDRLGLLFVISIFWGVFPSFNAVFVFPQERAIFIKERASGMYTLSSYFMAHIVGDLPMELILPTMFIAITYWMTGLKPEVGAFLLTVLVLLGYVLVSQGLGLAFGAIIMDAKRASTIVTVTMLAFVLTGGYYVHKVPSCLAWIKYLSTTFYSYRLLINVQYGQGNEIASLLGCSHGHRFNRASCKFIEEDIGNQIHPGMSIMIMFFMFIMYRMIAYFALRRITS
ncbi:hypothetical protein DCAR_0101075 [Daucus carota subsp. sativus]|uniref:ABC transporter domain-containing protein n=1 Tax=Daucus carota subsp. sativus TaxID=79200 RepID=A0A166G4B0_DAUCS|nr:PREDICTED: ABC transporter G family member 25 [Daucus carota subsp. sativus]WOG81919.1 hypothetical protein DCAR_0101075 [Daucus carota subsp. sativus]